MRNEQDAAGDAVIDVGRHLGGDLPRKVGTDAGDKRCGHDAAGLNDVGRGRRGQALDAHRARIGRLGHERPLSGLIALRRRVIWLCWGLRRGGVRRSGCEIRHGRHRSGPGAAAAEKHAAGARGVPFLRDALASGFRGLGARIGLGADRRDRDILPTLLGGNDRTTEVAGKRRHKFRNLAIILRP